MAFLERALRRLADLAFDSRVANSIALLVAQQRTILQDADIEKRLTQLEKTAADLAAKEGETPTWLR